MDKQVSTPQRVSAILMSLVVVGLSSCSTTPPVRADAAPAAKSWRQQTLLDADWLFHLGDIDPSSQVNAVNYDDKQWQQIQVPHDYVLNGTYGRSNARDHGYLPVDVGWYRKHLIIPASDRGKILKLDFDGVFRNSEVWLNGQSLGRQLSGYTPFSFDITKVAKLGADNVIAVRVDPRKFEGWWYEGGGIYRQVHLTALAPLHVAQWGTYVVSTVPNGEQGADAEAELKIQTTLENNGSVANCQVISEIVGPDGESLKTIQTPAAAPTGGQQQVAQQAVIDHPKLWSVSSPHLYQLRTTILQDGQSVDSTVTPFGIRTIRFDKDKGFFLNGKHIEIQGAACHQDFAGVGIAVPDSLEAWRVQQLKNMGCNGWRTAHDPANASVLDACDRLGMLVMDENRHLGDTYQAKTPAGTDSANLSDLATMIQRDRNHPSVIMWSMCNEEDLQGTPEAARLMSAMMKEVNRYDQTRPITSAMNGREGESIFMGHGIADVEDIIGVNYNYGSLDAIHKRHPDKPMFGSEDSNEKTTRGEYADNRAAGMCSAYNLSEKTWLSLETRPFIAGAYIWTGIDYKGEPNPFGWPDVSNNTGLMDSCGFPKDKYYYFESCWSDKPMVHLLPDSWNWPGKEGKKIRVIAFSNAKRVELFLNGQSLGSKDVPHDAHAEWQVPYQPGELTAKGATDGKVVVTENLQTTGAATRIELKADRTELHADGEDAVVAKVSIVDDQGRVVPDAHMRVTFQLTGGGQILGVGNGNPSDHDTDKSNQRNAFHGHCIAVLEAGSKPASLQLTATSPGLASGSISYEVR